MKCLSNQMTPGGLQRALDDTSLTYCLQASVLCHLLFKADTPSVTAVPETCSEDALILSLG